MDRDDPEQRIADLERQLAEQRRMVAPGRPAFSEASRSQGGYHQDEVDAFLGRIEATLRDPAARGAVTPADLHNVAFSKPPIGRPGYSEREVDAFLDLVKTELTRRVPGQVPAAGPEGPVRCLLYPYGGWDPQTPVVALDVDRNAIRVVDLKSNALMASVSLAEVTARPAQHGGGPVVVVDGPGLETLAITPHPQPGQWRKWPKSKKPKYVALEADWLMLVEKFGLASGLVDEFTPQTPYDHFVRFIQEGADHTPTTWRTPVAFGTPLFVVGRVYWSPLLILIGAALFVLAALFWRFKWEL